MKFDHRFILKESSPSMRRYEADGVSMRLDFCENMLRVALIRNGTLPVPTWSVWPMAGDCPLEGRDKLSADGLHLVSPEVWEDDEALQFALGRVDFTVEKKNFRISAKLGHAILYADRTGLAYNFAGELGCGSVHYTLRQENERIFGLGDKGGSVNKSGRSFTLEAIDSMGFHAQYNDPLYKQIPFYICENQVGSYGIYYDTYANGRMNFGQEHDNYFEPFNSARFEEENLVYYLFLGSTKEILQSFIALCGGMTAIPGWAFRYCGSTMEYTDAPDSDARLRGFVEKCEQESLRAGGFYLSSGYTQIGERRCVFHWNRDKIPSPENLSAYFREHGMEFMPNVKPAFLTEHPLYAMIAENGWFLHYADGSPARFPFWGGMASYLDFTNPEAYAFWKACVRTQLVEKGFRNIWNDNNEYDVLDSDVLACGFGKELPAKRIRPLFSYLMSRASRESCTETFGEDFIPLNVSRCGIAGTQRVASTWTGDNLTDFPDLRYNHYQAMTMALTGFSFFGPDIGGFAGPKPEEELFLRWLQYGVFLPRFVLHSWKPGDESTMPWLYPEKMDAVKKIFRLRERLLPYLQREYEKGRRENLPLLRPVFLMDPDYDWESDCFFCGEELLACPIFDKGARDVSVLLPQNFASWQLRGEGAPIPAGVTVPVTCSPEDEPVWFCPEGRKPIQPI